MSAALAGLSQYADSNSDSDGDAVPKTQPKVTIAKSSINNSADAGLHKSEVVAAAPKQLKRKLPPLEENALEQGNGGGSCSSLSPVLSGRNMDNAVRGDWLCYCFIEVFIDPSLRKCTQESHVDLHKQLGSDYTLLDLRHQDATNEEEEEAISRSKRDRLHISLTRPFTVRSYERDEYVKVATAEVQRLKATIGRFPFTFSRFAYLANDDASRHFMVLEVGSGRDKLHQVSSALSTELRRAFRAKPYYGEARFHASTACVVDATSKQPPDTEQSLASRISKIIADVEAKHGPQLRRCQQVWASRIGIQVANRITFVDL